MQFSDKMLEVKKDLEEIGHHVFVSGFVEHYAGKKNDDIDVLKNKHKFENNATKEFWAKMLQTEALLILNFDKNGIKNYIGGASLLDMGFAHFLNQKIFLWNPIPDI